jgi:hypothetical protein
VLKQGEVTRSKLSRARVKGKSTPSMLGKERGKARKNLEAFK